VFDFLNFLLAAKDKNATELCIQTFVKDRKKELKENDYLKFYDILFGCLTKKEYKDKLEEPLENKRKEIESEMKKTIITLSNFIESEKKNGRPLEEDKKEEMLQQARKIWNDTKSPSTIIKTHSLLTLLKSLDSEHCNSNKEDKKKTKKSNPYNNSNNSTLRLFDNKNEEKKNKKNKEVAKEKKVLLSNLI